MFKSKGYESVTVKIYNHSVHFAAMKTERTSETFFHWKKINNR